MNELEIKEKVRQGDLASDSKNIGEFIERRLGTDGFGFLVPNNWVFHDQIVEKVLQGDYKGIKPVCSEFDVTSNCSNRCTNCAYKLVKELEGFWIKNDSLDSNAQMQSKEYAKNLILKLKKSGIKGIIFSGGGEPFLFPHLEEVIKYATNLGIDSVSYTNGNVLIPSRIEKLVDARPLLVRVSLNAGTKEVYNAFHNPIDTNGAFNRTLQTIECLAKGNVKNPEMSVGVGVVINEKNQDDLVNAALRVREIAERTKGKIEFMTYRPEFNYYGKEQILDSILNKTFEIVERDVKAVLNGTGISVVNVGNRYKALKENTRNYTECRACGICSEITPMGAFFCCDRNFNRRYYIGSLESQDLGELYNGERRAEIFEYLSKKKCSICPPACKSHEINIQFNKVEEFRKEGKIDLVKLWIEEQRKMPKPKMVNFP
jgi:MoaA/NifB/PqqE/SkfB family radical SAM enzyme